jgi:hypothetical protein
MDNQLMFYAATRPVRASFAATITNIETQENGYKINYDNGAYDYITNSEGLGVAEGQAVAVGEIISLNDGNINYEAVIPHYGFENLFKSVRGYRLYLTGKIIDYRKLWIKYIDPNFNLYRLQCFINRETPSPDDAIFLANALEEDGEEYLKNNLSSYIFEHPVDPDNSFNIANELQYNDEVAIWIKREIQTPAATYLNNKFELGFKIVGYEEGG